MITGDATGKEAPMWGRERERDDRPLKVPGCAILEECEAFLDGSWIEHEAARGGPAPSWAWVAVLAHSDAERLTRLACDDRVHVPADRRPWWDAVAFLAGEILDTARGLSWSPEQLQRAALIPLELELLAEEASGRAAIPRDPQTFVGRVVTALDACSGQS
jgi:hypothetical protein